MRFTVGGGLVLLGGVIVFGAITGRLAAMLAALVKPSDLIDSDARELRSNGGGVAGTGSTPDVPPPGSAPGHGNVPAAPGGLA